jgi:hypothetical protein
MVKSGAKHSFLQKVLSKVGDLDQTLLPLYHSSLLLHASTLPWTSRQPLCRDYNTRALCWFLRLRECIFILK